MPNNASDQDAVVRNLCVVNDAAEKGVKLCHDYNDSARKEGNIQSILQVVENNKNQPPNQKKRKLKFKSLHFVPYK